ncbi:MAG: hypothetical protein KAQ87_02800, partial [Candidatus Pacebacteria bacterium]|nr:hypothetical protein [Candidatus Paceibacterota bacterium]
SVGIGTETPDQIFEILEATSSTPQLRLTQQDDTNYADFEIDSSGDLTIKMSGDDLLIDDNLWVSDGSPAIASVSGSGNLIVENKIYLSGDNENMPRHSCPTGWVLVPGDSDFGTEDFCVMKYEAKKDATTKNPSSVAAGTPWVSVSQYEAKNACTRIGAHLMTDAEWMTMARNIEGVTINDLDTDVNLQLGNGSSTSPVTYAAVTDPVISGCNLSESLEHADNVWASGDCELRGTNGNTADFGYTHDGASNFSIAYNSAADSKAKIRTHVLSNGEIIWDVAGNVWELTDAWCDTTSWHNTAAWEEWNDGDLTDYEQIVGGSTSNTSTNGVGKYYGCTTSGNVFRRSGSWYDGTNAGVFTLRLNYAPTVVGTDLGFRCAR